MSKPKSNTTARMKALGVDRRYLPINTPVSRAALERVLIDMGKQVPSAPLAVPVLDGEGRPVRPDLTIAIDELTRMVVGWNVRRPTANASA